MYVGLKQPRGDGERYVTPARAAAKDTTKRLTKFICGFLKCHSVRCNSSEGPFVTTLLILMPLIRKCFG